MDVNAVKMTTRALLLWTVACAGGSCATSRETQTRGQAVVIKECAGIRDPVPNFSSAKLSAQDRPASCKDLGRLLNRKTSLMLYTKAGAPESLAALASFSGSTRIFISGRDKSESNEDVVFDASPLKSLARVSEISLWRARPLQWDWVETTAGLRHLTIHSASLSLLPRLSTLAELQSMSLLAPSFPLESLAVFPVGLQKLFLRDVHMSNTVDLSRLPKLMSFDAVDLRFSKSTLTVSCSTALRIFSMRGGALQEFPRFVGCASLRGLSLSGGSFVELLTLKEFSSLKKLDLSNGVLKRVPLALDLPPGLLELDVTGNQIVANMVLAMASVGLAEVPSRLSSEMAM